MSALIDIAEAIVTSLNGVVFSLFRKEEFTMGNSFRALAAAQMTQSFTEGLIPCSLSHFTFRSS